MKILAIETSCDETAIAIIEAEGGFKDPKFKLLADNVNSQIEIHKEYGGVFPNLARREHTKNLIPILEKTLEETFGISNSGFQISKEKEEEIKEILEREPELLEIFLEVIPKIKKPEVNYIAVTEGPGLEPALWVGINFAKALSVTWDIHLIPVNHMEGHVLSPLLDLGAKIEWPALALLISGGHTELVLMKNWLQYELVGETQDDAVGEAFDKVARMMDLPYPGGPEISKLADTVRHLDIECPSGGIEIDNTSTSKSSKMFNFPKPMINSGNCHFSFSGLKTSVLYKIKDLNLDKETKAQMAREFEDTVVEILIKKTQKAVEENEVRTLIIGGGVIANKEIRKAFQSFAEKQELNLLIPEMKLCTDNAIMIGIAGYFRSLRNPSGVNMKEIQADGNLSLVA